RGDDGAQVFLRLRHLILEDERVERDVALHAAPVQKLHQLRQIRLREVVCSHACIDLLQAKKNRVGAVLYCRLRALPIASRRKEFGQADAFARGRARSRLGGWRISEDQATTESSSEVPSIQSLFDLRMLSD